MADRFTANNVTIAVSNYNGRAIIGDCLQSIFQLAHQPAAIIVIDDGSTDGSQEYLKREFPQVTLVERPVNSGGILNKVRNTALTSASTEFVFLVDNDVVLRPDCLDQLLHALQTLPHAAVAMPRTVYEHNPSLIYQDGQVLHYAGTSLAKNRNFPVAEANNTPRVSIGWGVQLIDRRAAETVGGFSEDYVIGWGDDAEFNHRLNLRRMFCYHVPDAVVLHKRVTGAKRYVAGTRNRWRFMLEFYAARTLLLCAPALAAYECALFGFLLMKGHAHVYVDSFKYVLANRASIARVRRGVQSTRLVRDRELMTSGDIFIASEYVDSKLLGIGFRALNAFLNGYWALVNRAL